MNEKKVLSDTNKSKRCLIVLQKDVSKGLKGHLLQIN